MPFSSDSGKALVDRCITRLLNYYDGAFFNEKQVLDIGPGSGTYSKRYRKQLSDFKWIGVEIWKPYVEKYRLGLHYDDIIEMPGQDYLADCVNSVDKRFGITFLGDVVEHVNKETAVKMVNDALAVSRIVIVSIPIIHYPQGEYDGNPFEAHVKDDWSHDEVMNSLPHIAWYGVENEIGVYFCTKYESLVKQILEPKIGVYAIGKNEIKFAERFYDSVIQADSITIVDTGSTDGTVELLKGFEVENELLTVTKASIKPWRFDDARNIALALAPVHLDMMISVDFDELLEPGWKEILKEEILKDFQSEGKVKDRYYHRFETIWDWDTAGKNVSSHWHERIHSRFGFQWKLPVHEVLVKGNGTPENIKWLGAWKMIQKPDNTKPRGSYLKMLEVSVKEDPNRWKSWSFLGAEYQGARDYEAALKAFERGIELPEADVPFLMMQIARLHQSSGNLVAASGMMDAAAFKNSDSRELACYAAELHTLMGNSQQAAMMLHLASTRLNRNNGYSYDPTCWDEGFEARKAA